MDHAENKCFESSSSSASSPTRSSADEKDEGLLPLPAVVVYSLDPLQESLGAVLEGHDSIWAAAFERLCRSTLRCRRSLPASLKLVVHAVDGRTLLVDDDGYYTEFLRDTDGRVAVALAGVSTSDDVLASAEVVTELVEAGQATVGKLFLAGRFFTWKSKPSATQLDRIAVLAEPAAEPPFVCDLTPRAPSPLLESTDSRVSSTTSGGSSRHPSDDTSATSSSQFNQFQNQNNAAGISGKGAAAALRLKAMALPLVTHLTNFTSSLQQRFGEGGGVAATVTATLASSRLASPRNDAPLGDDSDWVYDDFDEFHHQEEDQDQDDHDLAPSQDDIAV
eukprot:CAMPEP_0118890504 /NCGR_PEP_ID=MMETSP1166-20130328/936_1 /TAXON_ID=1104430 /ORGANISM="Chrysoreinhardia sp, Strain CCMP3193" /LENGTH=334 /DNA_ID=CAMNT_0006829117 /DNA_START=16 /DNA_END=1020 /DNA_ORIENTATION=-